ncbi:MAG: hypothetical protein ACTSRU_05455 [Candidatus Hodarchaeales archaeon]
MVEIHSDYKAKYDRYMKSAISKEMIEDEEHWNEFFSEVFNSADPFLVDLRERFGDDWSKDSQYHGAVIGLMRGKTIKRERLQGTPMTILAGEVNFTPNMRGKEATFAFALGKIDSPEYDDDSYYLIEISGFDDAARPLKDNLKPGNVYKARGIEIQKNENTHKGEKNWRVCPIVTALSNDESRFDEIEADGFMTWEKFLDEKYGDITIKDAQQESNLSDNNHDFKFLKDLSLFDAFAITKGDGAQFGIMEWVDDSLEWDEATDKENTLTMLVEPTLAVKYRKNSSFHVFGKISPGKYGGSTMNPKVMIPILAVEKPEDERGLKSTGTGAPKQPDAAESQTIQYLKGKTASNDKKEDEEKEAPKKKQQKKMSIDDVIRDYEEEGDETKRRIKICDSYGDDFSEADELCQECELVDDCSAIANREE